VFDYLIYPKVPVGIQSYSVFKVSDTLDSALDYMGNLEVKYGVVNLILNTDYILSESENGTAGGTFALTFTEDGLQKIAANRPNNETLKDLEIKFQARINDSATMGTKIYNNAVLTYNNGYFTADETKETPQINRPEVHTGGRQFIKVDNVTQEYDGVLSEATFVVKNSENKYMKKDDNGKISWVTNVEEATIVNVNESDGTFEVTGLAYGDKGEPFNYKLEEVNVPTGYVDMDDLEFTIDANSYGDEISIDDNTKVTNVKRPIIPQTGGIGTVVFAASGIAMMGVAVVALKRKK
jgi:fimbrial isopeptide formation D2 family protein/LPXTG-motif cell wall-anchored protein